MTVILAIAQSDSVGLRCNRNTIREFRVSNYRIDFAREILGVPFTVGSVGIQRARDPERALRAAELRFARQHGVGDWRERADRAVIAEGGRV